MHIMGMMKFSYCVLLFGCLYHVESLSTLARSTCTFENATCICWHQYNAVYVNCSGGNVESIPGFNDSVIWLDLSHNRINEIRLQTIPKHLIHLDLSWNEIKNVTRGVFNSLPELSFLDLSYCKIHYVEEGSFSDLHNLRHLNISFNRNVGFASLPNLTFHLNKTRIGSLHLNGITCRTGAGTTLKRHHLDLIGTNITELSLESNRLEICERDVIKNLPKTLELLSMAKNRLKTGIYVLEFALMTGLKVLNTSFQQNPSFCPACVLDPCRDKKENFANTAGDSINGYEQHYDYNSPQTINWTIYSPPNLETFDFRSSTLYLLNTDVSVHAPNLRHVYFQHNFIVSLTKNFRMKNNSIVSFDISHNFCSHVSPQIFEDSRHLKHLNMSHNYLGQDLGKDTEGQLFKNLESLEMLDLSFNKIASLPKLLLGNSKRVRFINISNNRLSDWKISMSGMSKLVLLDLSQNKLTTLDENARTNIERVFKHSNLSIDLSENVLQCSCKNEEFLTWMSENEHHFINIDNYTCSPPNDGFSFKTLKKSVISLSKSCKSYLGWYVGCAVALAVFCSFVTGWLLVKNKWKIRYIIYKSKQKFGWIKQPSIHGSTSVNYEHDIFLSYSGCTLMFVLNEVIPRLEGNRNMKLIIKDRDYLPGFPKTDNIMHSLQESRKTVCVVSKTYLESRWRDYELNMAKIEGIVDRGRLDFVILILLPEVCKSGYPSKIMDLVMRNCYVEYPEEPCAYDDFWEKLVNMIES
ncbi:toll-like receptor 4 [Ostrea edulis]|uniref:toll-like receptor 4 n=1 Tax=Ostrea edulis TaxID=37623 RepID=UPI0024AEC3A7|nr:toll-like receptor 4 [Ostrea edulis]